MEVLQILRSLALFRPKELLAANNEYTVRDVHQDLLSVRHKELIGKSKDKFAMAPQHMAKFISSNLRGGVLRQFFADDSFQDSKLAASHFEVIQAYMRLYSNLEIRVND